MKLLLFHVTIITACLVVTHGALTKDEVKTLGKSCKKNFKDGYKLAKTDVCTAIVRGILADNSATCKTKTKDKTMKKEIKSLKKSTLKSVKTTFKESSKACKSWQKNATKVIKAGGTVETNDATFEFPFDSAEAKELLLEAVITNIPTKLATPTGNTLTCDPAVISATSSPGLSMFTSQIDAQTIQISCGELEAVEDTYIRVYYTGFEDTYDDPFTNNNIAAVNVTCDSTNNRWIEETSSDPTSADASTVVEKICCAFYETENEVCPTAVVTPV